MRIGELSERTGTPRRLLRYYEEQRLIAVDRSSNGYREYDEVLVDRVLQIRGLLDVGLPTRIIKEILPCLDEPRAIHVSGATPEMIATLELERDQMTERIQGLIRNRDAVAAYLATVRVNHRPRTASAAPSAGLRARTGPVANVPAGARSTAGTPAG
ncbi:MerR family transcriptional regulator [Streptomyces sp. NPDC048255]|uniref:MerR family transcriptional regulator n=1 Tax=Streptomyces sp. NPDC048255 TaxID=3154713 RepID=UPI0033C2FCEF